MPDVTEAYIREKFGAALSELATGLRSLPERVRNAMAIVAMFSPEDMPDKWSRETFAELLYRSTDREATGEEGQLAATLEGMEMKDVQDLARMIVDLQDHLVRRLDVLYAADQEPAGDDAGAA
jgi:hypothetical protein